MTYDLLSDLKKYQWIMKKKKSNTDNGSKILKNNEIEKKMTHLTACISISFLCIQYLW